MPFPVRYASVQLKRLNKGFYQFEIRSEKKLLFCWLYLYQPDWRPVREILSVSLSASQGNQCLLSHFLASLGAQEKTNCTSMLWSIDSCQNRVSADQYHLTVSRAQVSTHRGRVFFEVIRWQITSFKWSQAQVYFFQWFIWNMSCLCHYGPALSRFWFQTDLGRENSATFLKIKAGKTFSYHGHAVRQFLCSDWSKFDRWVHAENLCSILKVVYFGGVYMTPGRLSPGAS